MRTRVILILIFTTGLLQPLTAQGPGGMGGRPGSGPGRMMRGRMAEPPSRDLIEGPYAPDSMIPKFALDSVQGPRYRAAWDSMMAATRPVRDSVREATGGLERARGEGYQREGGRRSAEIQRLAKTLKKEEERFDKVVRRILTQEQWEEFKDWRDRRRRTEKELRQEQMGEGIGGPRRRG
jgi:hypothetical protein